jgi:hypothetical protein
MDDSEDDAAVTPQLHYGDPKDSESELVVGLSNAPGPETVYMTVAMFLDSPDDSFRNAHFCPDAIGIGFRKSDWASTGVPEIKATNQHDARFTSEDVAEDALAGTVNLYDDYERRPPAIPSERFPPSGTTLTGELSLRTDEDPSVLSGTYTHTWSFVPIAEISKITGGKGGLGVEVDNGSNCWSLAKGSDPEDYV